MTPPLPPGVAHVVDDLGRVCLTHARDHLFCRTGLLPEDLDPSDVAALAMRPPVIECPVCFHPLGGRPHDHT